MSKFGARYALTLKTISPSVDSRLTPSSTVMDFAEVKMILPEAIRLCSALVTVMPSTSLRVNPPEKRLLYVKDLKSGKVSSPSPPSMTSWPMVKFESMV